MPKNPPDPVSDDPEQFARDHFPALCRLPFAPYHHLLFAWHRRMGAFSPERTGLRFALAAPRGYAKSSIVSFLLPMHDVMCWRERYIVLLSATRAQAHSRLHALRRQLEERAIRAGPDRDRFAAGGITFRGIRIEAYGAGQEIRGLGHGEVRPTKIILDDADASAAATSRGARRRLADWFADVVEYLGDRYTHILAIGTVLHRQSLLAVLLERHDFEPCVVRAVESFPADAERWAAWRAILLDPARDGRRGAARAYFLENRAAMEEGARVAWPEKEDIEDLQAQLLATGRRAFYQEKQNQPMAAEDAFFAPERILAASESGGMIELRTPGGAAVRTLAAAAARRIGFLDPALGKTRASDFASIATVLRFDDGTLVAESVIARRMPPTQQIARLFDAHAARPFDIVGVEGTGFQELLAGPIEEERRRRRSAGLPADLPVRLVYPRRSKTARIAALEPLFENGLLALGRQLDEEFLEELSSYPRSRHDDALDALAAAAELARDSVAKLEWQGVGTRPRGERGF